MTDFDRPALSREATAYGVESARWWRIAFVSYAVLLFIATHWPKLDLGPPDMPSPDKMLHLFAFGGFTVLAWMTGLFHRFGTGLRPVILLVFIVSIYVVLDECTQALPILGRQFSLQDVVAGLAGVFAVSANIAALRWTTRGMSRMRHAWINRVLERMFARPFRDRTTFMTWALTPLVFGPIGVSILLHWPQVVKSLPNPLHGIVYGVSHALWLGLGLHFASQLWTKRAERARAEQWCAWCGHACAESAHDEHGVVTCPTCGGRVHRGVWLPATPPEGPLLRRVLTPAVVVGFVSLMLLFGGIALATMVFNRVVQRGGSVSTLRELTNASREFSMTIDLAVMLLAIAIGAILVRRRIARLYDEQGRTCRRCGYDLTATPVEEGLGTCPECGTAFAVA